MSPAEYEALFGQIIDPAKRQQPDEHGFVAAVLATGPYPAVCGMCRRAGQCVEFHLEYGGWPTKASDEQLAQRRAFREETALHAAAPIRLCELCAKRVAFACAHPVMFEHAAPTMALAMSPPPETLTGPGRERG